MSTTDQPQPPDQPTPPLTSVRHLLVALAWVLFFSCIVLICGGLLMVGVERMHDRGERTQTANNLKQCALGVHNAHDLNKNFPPFYGYYGAIDPINTPGSPQASFFVHLLPYVESGPTYQTWVTDPNSSNKPGVIVPPYLSPADYSRINDGGGSVNFAVNLRLWQTPGESNSKEPTLGPFTGEGRPIKVSFPSSFKDGTSNTLLFATKLQVCGANPSTLINTQPAFTGTNRGPFFGWTHATPANQSLPSAGLGWQAAPIISDCLADVNMAQSYFPSAIQVALCDASVRSISSTMTFGTWTMALTPNGGETMPPEWVE
jgi:Protein of unknown function (DUF1559)